MLLASRPSKLLPASAVGEKQKSVCALLLHPSLHWEATQGDMESQHAVAFLDLSHQWCIPERLLNLGYMSLKRNVSERGPRLDLLVWKLVPLRRCRFIHDPKWLDSPRFACMSDIIGVAAAKHSKCL